MICFRRFSMMGRTLKRYKRIIVQQSLNLKKKNFLVHETKKTRVRRVNKTAVKS